VFGAFPFGAPYFGQSPNVDPDTLPPPIVLRYQDASVLIVRPRNTQYALSARKTLHIVPRRDTVDGD
jgi:hypothetical protein